MGTALGQRIVLQQEVARQAKGIGASRGRGRAGMGAGLEGADSPSSIWSASTDNTDARHTGAVMRNYADMAVAEQRRRMGQGLPGGLGSPLGRGADGVTSVGGRGAAVGTGTEHEDALGDDCTVASVTSAVGSPASVRGHSPGRGGAVADENKEKEKQTSGLEEEVV